jgi:hypothetical protein
MMPSLLKNAVASFRMDVTKEKARLTAGLKYP